MQPIDPKQLTQPTPRTGRGRPVNPIAEAMRQAQQKTPPKVK
jgi:hypothetical protein